MTDFISYHFFPFAAKEWHRSIVCPCCLLGKEYLSFSDRCWHYHLDVLPTTGSWPVHSNGLTGGYRRTTETVVHRFRLGKMAMLILAGAEDDVIIMVLTHRAPQKNWFLLSTPCQRHKKEGELTSLIYGPLVNDDTPSTPFHTVPVHDTSISINSHHPSECSHSPLRRTNMAARTMQQQNGLVFCFSATLILWNAGGLCETFNWIPFWIRSLPKHWYGLTFVFSANQWVAIKCNHSVSFGVLFLSSLILECHHIRDKAWLHGRRGFCRQIFWAQMFPHFF